MFASQGNGCDLVLCVASVHAALSLSWFSSLGAATQQDVVTVRPPRRAGQKPAVPQGAGGEGKKAKAAARLGKALLCVLSPSRRMFYSEVDS